MQTNFPQSEHYPSDWLQIHAGELDELARISIAAAKKNPAGPELIIWPEVPAPFSLQDPAFAARAVRIARESGTDFLVGVVDWKQDAQTKWLASNSAVLSTPRAGEFIPMIKFTWCRLASTCRCAGGSLLPDA